VLISSNQGWGRAGCGGEGVVWGGVCGVGVWYGVVCYGAIMRLAVRCGLEELTCEQASANQECIGVGVQGSLPSEKVWRIRDAVLSGKHTHTHTLRKVPMHQHPTAPRWIVGPAALQSNQTQQTQIHTYTQRHPNLQCGEKATVLDGTPMKCKYLKAEAAQRKRETHRNRLL
jgi:hypothetical protein